MKRRPVHLSFLGMALVAAGFMAWQAWEMREAGRINQIVDSIADETVQGEQAGQRDESDDVRVLLRWASALSMSGQDSEAERLFGILARDGNAADIRVIAQYNLANHYLRQAMSSEVEANAVMPLVELAKQRYRDALKQNPGHMHARFNLEQALRLAPERSETGSSEEGDPIKSVDVIVPDFERGDLP